MNATQAPGGGLDFRAAGKPAVSIEIPVSEYHFLGMFLAGMCGWGGTADGWSSHVLSLLRLPKPVGPFCLPSRPTGRVVTAQVPLDRLDAIQARATRAGLTVEAWIHAALVGASRNYRACLDRTAGGVPRHHIEPAPPPLAGPSNVLPFFAGRFRETITSGQEGEP